MFSFFKQTKLPDEIYEEARKLWNTNHSVKKLAEILGHPISSFKPWVYETQNKVLIASYKDARKKSWKEKISKVIGKVAQR